MAGKISVSCWSRFSGITSHLLLEHYHPCVQGSCGKPQQQWCHDACGCGVLLVSALGLAIKYAHYNSTTLNCCIREGTACCKEKFKYPTCILPVLWLATYVMIIMITTPLQCYTLWTIYELTVLFGLTEKALFQIILGLLSLSISVCRLRERGCMSKSGYVHVVHDLELLRYVLRCVIKWQL